MIYTLLTQTPENNHEGDKSIYKTIFFSIAADNIKKTYLQFYEFRPD
jgi:hypothetical protein